MAAKKAKKTTAKEKTAPKTESFKVAGETFMNKLRQIIKEGNVRRIIIKDKKGKSIAEFPLTIGVVGTILVPILAAIGAVVALVKECTITVEKH